MKKFFIIICCAVIAAACARKTVPPKTIELNNNNAETNIPDNNINNSETVTDSIVVAPTMAVMVVADGYGRLITSKDNLPDSDIKYSALQLSKGFTAQQRSNLQTRYHIVPPRVLYVTESYRLHSLKGIYYIYRKKFWYWKRTDGLFYLDQKYYQ